MWTMDWSEWKEGDDYPVGVPLWSHTGEPIGRVSEIKDCCGGLMFKVDMNMSIYKKPKKKEKKKMFGSKNKEIKRLKKDLEFWMNMDDLNNKIFRSYHDIFRNNEATIRMLEETNAKLKDRLASADNADQYWLKKALSAREALIRKDECSGYSYTSALDALKIYTLKSENLQLKKDLCVANARLVSANNAVQYWLNKTVSAREKYQRLNESFEKVVQQRDERDGLIERCNAQIKMLQIALSFANKTTA